MTIAKYNKFRSMVSDGLRAMDFDFDFMVLYDCNEWTIDDDTFMGKPIVRIPAANTTIGYSDYYPTIIPAWLKDNSYTETALNKYLKGCNDSQDRVEDQKCAL